MNKNVYLISMLDAGGIMQNEIVLASTMDAAVAGMQQKLGVTHEAIIAQKPLNGPVSLEVA